MESNTGRPRTKGWLIALICVLCAALIGAGYFLYTLLADDISFSGNYIMDDFSIVTGVTVDGSDFSGLARDEAAGRLTELSQQMLDDFTVKVTFVNNDFVYGATELGIITNADEVLENITAFGNSGSYAERSNARAAAQQSGQDFDLAVVFDADVAKTEFQNKAGEYSVTPVDATLTFTASATNAAADGKPQYFTYTDEQNGYDIDIDGLVSELQSKISAGELAIEVTAPFVETPPAVTKAMLASRTSLVGEFSTTKLGGSSNDKNRIFNIQKFADLIDGTVLQPGEVWSANDTAGKRTLENGWKDAAAINDGRFVPEPGGGVCQVSTTIYNAAIRAEMEIVDRRNHSIKSSYVDYGLDATIESLNSNIDLKIKNQYDVPLYFIMKVVGDELKCQIYGPPLDGYYVDFKGEKIADIEQPPDEYREGTKLPGTDGEEVPFGTTVLYRQGRPGAKAKVTKYWYDAATNELIKTEQFGDINTYAARSTVYYTNFGGTYYADPAVW